jgi:hypothetical protein
VSYSGEIAWFAPKGSACRKHLDRLWTLADSIRERASLGHTYRSIVHDQYMAAIDKMAASGQLQSMDSGSSLSGPIGVAPNLAQAMLYASTNSSNQLRQFVVKNQLAVSTCCQVFFDALESRKVAPAFSDLRAIIEHVAHATLALRKCEAVECPQNPAFMEANAFLNEVREILVKSNYATRVDWKQLFLDQTPLRKRETLKYGPGSSRIDVRAKSIANALQKIDKRIEGLSNVYDLLCEFTHPNAGTHFAFLEEGRIDEFNRNGLLWKEVTIGPDVPKLFLKDFGRFAEETVECVAECLEAFTEFESQAESLCLRLTEASQIMARRVLATKPGLFEVYHLCPCMSGNKVKFCCGRNLC